MRSRLSRALLLAVPFALLSACQAPSAPAATHDLVQARIDTDLAAGKPIVVHVVVALCDNRNQGIVPVPAKLGNGQQPRTNLYWGALYGVKTHLIRNDWRKVGDERPSDPRILERVVLTLELARGERQVPAYLVADAWDGAEMEAALLAFQSMAAGASREAIRLNQDQATNEIAAGGAAHLVAFVGHNGLMEIELPPPSRSSRRERMSSSIVLACASRPDFEDRLRIAGSHPLLLTTGLMAPEAYTLDAAIRRWAANGTPEEIREAAARAYQRYQKCGLRAARGLFWGM